jgi:hypothetical protein
MERFRLSLCSSDRKTTKDIFHLRPLFEETSGCVSRKSASGRFAPPDLRVVAGIAPA